MAALVVIVGETASGKSALAMDLARKFNGEIICADSRTIYKGMDIGTAKPSKEEQAEVSHHLLDLVEPGARFTAADFKELANEAISDIAARGKLPIMVGGTGLYIGSLIYDFQFREGEERDPLNPRHRNLPATDKTLRSNTLIIGLQTEREELKDRIEKRVEVMLTQDLEKEVKNLAQKYGWDCEAMKGIGYREWQEYFAGQADLTETKQAITKSTQDYAKRQRTWFKRNKSIHWQNDPSKVVEIITTFLNK